MWTYNQTPPQCELYHYGVPGMKWGVRKALALKGREFGVLNKDYKIASNKEFKTGEKIAARKAAGKEVSDKLQKKHDLAKQKAKKISTLLKKNYKDLSEEDKLQGRTEMSFIGGISITQLGILPGLAVRGVVRNKIRKRAYARG